MRNSVFKPCLLTSYDKKVFFYQNWQIYPDPIPGSPLSVCAEGGGCTCLYM